MKARVRLVRAKELDPEQAVWIAADRMAVEDFRKGKFRFGQEVVAEFRKNRNPQFHRLAHAFAKVMTQHCDEFVGYNAHDLLKRLQIESDAGCRSTLLDLEGMKVWHRVPESLSFESMDEVKFQDVLGKIADYAARKYLDSTGDEVMKMAADLSENLHDG